MLRQLTLAAATVVVAATLPAHASGDAEAGKAKSAQCAQCHSADGNSKVAQFPRLAGQHADYIVHALKDYASGRRRNPIMAGIAKGLSEDDREELAAYFSAQRGLHTARRP